jgi:peptidoglycan-associated lipoprotein
MRLKISLLALPVIAWSLSACKTPLTYTAGVLATKMTQIAVPSKVDVKELKSELTNEISSDLVEKVVSSLENSVKKQVKAIRTATPVLIEPIEGSEKILFTSYTNSLLNGCSRLGLIEVTYIGDNAENAFVQLKNEAFKFGTDVLIPFGMKKTVASEDYVPTTSVAARMMRCPYARFAPSTQRSQNDNVKLSEASISSTETKKNQSSREQVTSGATRAAANLQASRSDSPTKVSKPLAYEKNVDEKKVSLPLVTYFAYDSAKLSTSALAELENFIGHYESNLTGSISVEGHADERGTREYNIALGSRRASAVADYLAAQGMDKSQMTEISFGKERPVSKGSTEEAWRLNRRVEIHLK